MLKVNPDIGQREHPRHKVLKEGKIIPLNMNSVIDVKIHDLSIGGARVQIPVNTDLPEAFCLLIVSDGVLYPAVARWRNGEMTGIAFVGKARSGHGTARQGYIKVTHRPAGIMSYQAIS